MGPRPFGRGRFFRRVEAPPQTLASMGPRPFGRGRQMASKFGEMASASLQWGRDLSVAEGGIYALGGSIWN